MSNSVRYIHVQIVNIGADEWYGMSTDSSIPHTPISIPLPHMIMMFVSYVSMMFYIYIVILILINRHKYTAIQNAFYGLLLNQAFADLCIFLIIELLLRPRKFRLLPIFTPQKSTLFAKFFHLAMVTARSAMFLGYFPFALNRFTIFWRPLLHRDIWTQNTAFLSAFLQWFPPLLVNCIAYFAFPSEVTFVEREGGLLHMMSDENLAFVSSIQTIITGVLVTIICAVLYMFSYRYVRKIKLSDHAAKYERRLFICAAITFIPMILEAFRSVLQMLSLYAFNMMSVYTTCTELFFFTAEIASITQPWTILLTNKLIRTLIWKPKPKASTTGTPFMLKRGPPPNKPVVI